MDNEDQPNLEGGTGRGSNPLVFLPASAEDISAFSSPDLTQPPKKEPESFVSKTMGRARVLSSNITFSRKKKTPSEDHSKLPRQKEETGAEVYTSGTLTFGRRKSVRGSQTVASAGSTSLLSSNSPTPPAAIITDSVIRVPSDGQPSPHSPDEPSAPSDTVKLRTWYKKYRRDGPENSSQSSSASEVSAVSGNSSTLKKPAPLGSTAPTNDMSKWYEVEHINDAAAMDPSSPVVDDAKRDSLVERLLVKRKRQESMKKSILRLPFEDLQFSKQEIRRQEIIYEFIVTERDYVADLNVLSNLFLKKIREKKLLSPNDIKKIFLNVEELVGVNEVLYKKLHERRTAHFEAAIGVIKEKNGSIESIRKRAASIIQNYTIGDVLNLLTPYLRSYTIYCGSQPEAAERLQARLAYSNLFNGKSSSSTVKPLDGKAMKKLLAESKDLDPTTKDLALFMQYCSFRPECRNLDVFSFLIKPVQRICKYPLLLRELLKFTDSAHPDHALLTKTMGLIEKVVSEVNERRRFFEGQQVRILELRKQLVFDEALLLGIKQENTTKVGKDTKDFLFDIVGEASRKVVYESGDPPLTLVTLPLTSDVTHIDSKHTSQRNLIICSDIVILAKLPEKKLFAGGEEGKSYVRTVFKLLDIISIAAGADGGTCVDEITLGSKRVKGFLWNLVLDVLGKAPSDVKKKTLLKGKSKTTSPPSRISLTFFVETESERDKYIDVLQNCIKDAKAADINRKQKMEERAVVKPEPSPSAFDGPPVTSIDDLLDEALKTPGETVAPGLAKLNMMRSIGKANGKNYQVGSDPDLSVLQNGSAGNITMYSASVPANRYFSLQATKEASSVARHLSGMGSAVKIAKSHSSNDIFGEDAEEEEEVSESLQKTEGQLRKSSKSRSSHPDSPHQEVGQAQRKTSADKLRQEEEANTVPDLPTPSQEPQLKKSRESDNSMEELQNELAPHATRILKEDLASFRSVSSSLERHASRLGLRIKGDESAALAERDRPKTSPLGNQDPAQGSENVISSAHSDPIAVASSETVAVPSTQTVGLKGSIDESINMPPPTNKTQCEPDELKKPSFSLQKLREKAVSVYATETKDREAHSTPFAKTEGAYSEADSVIQKSTTSMANLNVSELTRQLTQSKASQLVRRRTQDYKAGLRTADRNGSEFRPLSMVVSKSETKVNSSPKVAVKMDSKVRPSEEKQKSSLSVADYPPAVSTEKLTVKGSASHRLSTVSIADAAKVVSERVSRENITNNDKMTEIQSEFERHNDRTDAAIEKNSVVPIFVLPAESSERTERDEIPVSNAGSLMQIFQAYNSGESLAQKIDGAEKAEESPSQVSVISQSKESVGAIDANKSEPNSLANNNQEFSVERMFSNLDIVADISDTTKFGDEREVMPHRSSSQNLDNLEDRDAQGASQVISVAETGRETGSSIERLSSNLNISFTREELSESTNLTTVSENTATISNAATADEDVRIIETVITDSLERLSSNLNIAFDKLVDIGAPELKKVEEEPAKKVESHEENAALKQVSTTIPSTSKVVKELSPEPLPLAEKSQIANGIKLPITKEKPTIESEPRSIRDFGSKSDLSGSKSELKMYRSRELLNTFGSSEKLYKPVIAEKPKLAMRELPSVAPKPPALSRPLIEPKRNIDMKPHTEPKPHIEPKPNLVKPALLEGDDNRPRSSSKPRPLSLYSKPDMINLANATKEQPKSAVEIEQAKGSPLAEGIAIDKPSSPGDIKKVTNLARKFETLIRSNSFKNLSDKPDSEVETSSEKKSAAFKIEQIRLTKPTFDDHSDATYRAKPLRKNISSLDKQT